MGTPQYIALFSVNFTNSFMVYNKITPYLIELIAQAVGTDAVFSDAEMLEKHSRDYTENLQFLPEIVVEPRNTEGVSALLKICNDHRIPVTTQGARSGLAGAALPVLGGAVLSMKRFDKILNIDKANFQVTVEPAVITELLQNELITQNLFYPPDPAGRGLSSIGGNVATNAGGPKCVKYGVTRDYVLNLEIVLPTGEVMWTGANVLKNSTGYNLTQLLVGSEGTLAVVTKIVLRLLPLPPFSLLLLAPFQNSADACAAVSAIFSAGITPSSLEFMEKKGVEMSAKYLKIKPLNTSDQLLIEVDGNDLTTLQNDCERIAEVLQNFNVGDILFADSEAQKRDLWQIRRNVSNAVKQLATIKIGEDTVVPRSKLPELLRGAKLIAQENGVETVCWGHLGDGNLHINIITEQPLTAEFEAAAHQAKQEIFELTKSLGGMLSAEHGVGLVQKPYISIFYPPIHLEILRGIKKVFDPNRIMNPNKIF
jgi:glycolate oxidase